jgi:cytochrome c oxidase assembly protein subunit 17
MGAASSSQSPGAAPLGSALLAPSAAPPGVPIGPDGKPKKICCSCPDTKRLRDTCIAERGAWASGLRGHQGPCIAAVPPRWRGRHRSHKAHPSPRSPCAGEEHAYCQALIEAHKACLRVEGFKVRARRERRTSGAGAAVLRLSPGGTRPAKESSQMMPTVRLNGVAGGGKPRSCTEAAGRVAPTRRFRPSGPCHGACARGGLPGATPASV